MLEIEFWDRERETEEVMRILNARPDLIIFIYGPINSGKTELIQHLIRKLSQNFVIFYINLRERMIRDYNDFIEALFEIDVRDRKRIVIKELIAEITKFAGIPISKSLLDSFFEEDRPKNAFRYIVNVVKDIRGEGKIPVLIVDELQKIGDVKVDDYLIYELFNLFIRLTKELHACHVFTITSDSLFLEKIYSEAMLQGRAEYLLVDDFDYNTTAKILKRYGFSDEEVELTWKYFGGKPSYLVRAVRAKLTNESLKGLAEKYLKIRIRQIKDAIYELDDDMRKRVIELFKEFSEADSIAYEWLTDEIRFCVRKNVLFVDPVESVVKPQSRLDLLAIQSVI